MTWYNKTQEAMPRVVNAAVRRLQIATAALAVARRGGVEAITFRSVAEELGSSTTVVTHYVKTRAELVGLAFRQLFDAAHAVTAAAIDGLGPAEGLRVLVESFLPLDEERRLQTYLWLGVLQDPEARENLRGEMRAVERWERERLTERCRALGLADPETAADLAVAMANGITFEALQNPRRWTPRRQREVAGAFLALLGVDGGAPVTSR